MQEMLLDLSKLQAAIRIVVLCIRLSSHGLAFLMVAVVDHRQELRSAMKKRNKILMMMGQLGVKGVARREAGRLALQTRLPQLQSCSRQASSVYLPLHVLLMLASAQHLSMCGRDPYCYHALFLLLHTSKTLTACGYTALTDMTVACR